MALYGLFELGFIIGFYSWLFAGSIEGMRCPGPSVTISGWVLRRDFKPLVA